MKEHISHDFSKMGGFILNIVLDTGVLKYRGIGGIKILKKFFYSFFRGLGYFITIDEGAMDLDIADKKYYAPTFMPWIKDGYGDFGSYSKCIKNHTVVSPDRQYTLFTLAKQAIHIDGDWVECGVYKGGTAILLAKIMKGATLHLFDTFSGMPATNSDIDIMQEGTFSDCSFDEVKKVISEVCTNVKYYKGVIPNTFNDCDIDKIAIAHVDVDLFESAIDCCKFIYPRLSAGGFIVFDDYGFADCPGVKKAVDEFFEDKPEVPLVLQTGQAIIVKVV